MNNKSPKSKRKWVFSEIFATFVDETFFLLNDMILAFFRYIYYRTLHAYLNFGWSYRFSSHCSFGNVGGSILFNLISIVLLCVYLAVGPIKDDTEMMYYSIAIPCLLITFLLMGKIVIVNDNDDGKFYNELNTQYGCEKYRQLKGVLVFLYYVLTLIVFISLGILVIWLCNRQQYYRLFTAYAVVLPLW